MHAYFVIHAATWMVAVTDTSSRNRIRLTGEKAHFNLGIRNTFTQHQHHHRPSLN